MKRPSLGHVVRLTVAIAAAVLAVSAVLVVGCGDSPEKAALANARAARFFDRAEEAFRAGAYGPALMLADSAAVHDPTFTGVDYLRGRIYTEMERYEEAAEAYRRVARREPENRAVTFNLANNAYRRDQYREAVRGYHEVLAAIDRGDEVRIYVDDPGGVRARYAVLLQLGRTYARLGRADSARTTYRQAIAARPEAPEAHEALSRVLENLGEFDAALAHARRALAIDPANLDYRFGVGSLLLRSGRYREALPLLREVAQARPHERAAHYNLGQALTHLGRDEEARIALARADSLQAMQARLDQLAEAVRTRPEDLRNWVEYGHALRAAGRLDQARRVLTRALELAPRNVALQNNLAILAVEAGDTTGAIRRYHAILAQDPRLVDVWTNLGAVYAGAGDTARARRAWQRALQIDPGHAAARTYLDGYGGE